MLVKQSKNKSISRRIIQVEEAYAWVSSPDGRGSYNIHGVIPNPVFGTQTVYVLIARVSEGVQGGYIRPSHPDDDVARLRRQASYIVKIPVAEALALFVDPMVQRTETMPEEAIPTIRWFEKFRSQASIRHLDLVPQLLDEQQLEEMAQFDVLGDDSETSKQSAGSADESSSVDDRLHCREFTKYFHENMEQFSGWFLYRGSLSDLGCSDEMLDSKCVNPIQLREKICQSNYLVQRFHLMACHLRLLYTLDGKQEIADMWSAEIALQLNRFGDSGEVSCLLNMSVAVLNYERSLPTQATGVESWWGNDVDDLQFDIQAIRIFMLCSMWFYQPRSDNVDSLSVDLLTILCERFHLGIYQVENKMHEYGVPIGTMRLSNSTMTSIAEQLSSFMCVQVMDYQEGSICELTKPLSSDPPATLVSLIVSTLVQTGDLPQDQIRERGTLITRAFWHILSMAVNPQHFDFPKRLGGRGIRRTTAKSRTPLVIPQKASSLKEALVLYIDTVCKLKGWRQQFALNKRIVSEHFSTLPDPSEVDVFASNKYFTIQTSSGKTMPSQILLEALVAGNGDYVSRSLKEVARKAPRTTVRLLEAATALRDISIQHHTASSHEAYQELERNRRTSTTSQKGVCIACGKKEAGATFTMMKCSRCNIARYCSKECQATNWEQHSKICLAAVL